MEFAPANEVKQVAQKLIEDYHHHLFGFRIEYIFLSECPKQKGKLVWGRARKVSGLNAYLATDEPEAQPEPFFVVEIVKPVWDELTPLQREALVSHELHHIGWDEEKDQPMMKGHDCEEFIGVIQRYGLWREDVKLFVEVARDQGAFDFAELENKLQATLSVPGTDVSVKFARD